MVSHESATRCRGPDSLSVIVPVSAVLLAGELPHHLADVQRVRRPFAAHPLLFDPADHSRVEAETRRRR